MSRDSRMTFHGQLGQDELVYNHFFKGRPGKGTFLEVGASDGVQFSNTLFFERELGWRGMCVEANPADYELLCQNRRSINVFGAAYDRQGVVSFRCNTGRTKQLSGVEESYHPLHAQRIASELQEWGGSTRLTTVPCFTLTDTLLAHDMPVVDYMSLDVEGAEMRVLRGIDFDRITVKVMTIEDNYGQEAELDELLLPRGFAKLGRVSHDLIYFQPA